MSTYATPPPGVTPVRCCGQWIDLLTAELYEGLPDGTVVVSIHGKRLAKGIDYIDQDVRGGQIAFGLPVSQERAAHLTAQYGTP